jgi:hypothetical protein
VRFIGDAAGWSAGRQVGGLLNAVTLLLFLVNTVSALQSPPERAGTAQGRGA